MDWHLTFPMMLPWRSVARPMRHHARHTEPAPLAEDPCLAAARFRPRQALAMAQAELASTRALRAA